MAKVFDRKPATAVPVRRPFWLPASNYYVMTAGIAVAMFFLLWGILHDGGDDAPWVASGISAGVFIIAAVLLREIFLRRARYRYLKAKQEFDRNLSGLYVNGNRRPQPEKLTLEKNATLLRDIKKKSDAANVLGRFSAGHREVFELCGEYLVTVERELATISPQSPRLAALNKSRRSVAEFHRYHLLQWAAIETRGLMHEAGTRVESGSRIEAAQDALEIVDAALVYYPDDTALLDSRQLVADTLASIKVSHWVERAERAEFDGDYASARNFYRDALFYLGREGRSDAARDEAAARINEKIQRIERLDDAQR